MYAVNNPDFEDVTEDLIGQEVLRIRNLTKTYQTRNQVPTHALRGLISFT